MSLSPNAFTAAYTDAYGIKCASPASLLSRQGVYPTFCQIAPGKESTFHAHFEEEVFYIIQGSGRMTIEDQDFAASKGDLIRIPPHSHHTLHNSGDQTLIYLSVYSEDLQVAPIAARALVTAAPPTPNGPVHLGHMSGPYLAADIINRYLKLRGSDSQSYTGTDDHQNYVALAAQKKRQDTLLFRNEMRARIEKGFERVDIQFDMLYSPLTDNEYQTQVRNFFVHAAERQVIIKESLQLPYCTTCAHTLRDGLVSGKCPQCRNGSSGTCESCGIVFTPDLLLDAQCSVCQRPASSRATEVFTFDVRPGLDALIPELEDSYDLPPHVLKMFAAVAAHKQHKIIVAYPADEKPAKEITYHSHAIHVWFEMAAHFSTLAKQDQTWIHAFGFDNSFHYLLFIPTLWRAIDPVAKLPDSVVINEFLNLEGQKFSTSRNHAIWIDESRGNSDHLRLFLASHRPQEAEDNFSASAFDSFSKDLHAKFLRLETLIHNERSVAGSLSDAKSVQKALHAANRFTRDIEHHLSFATLDLRRAAHRLLEFIDVTSSRTSYHHQADLLLVRALIVALKPFMPRESDRLAAELQTALVPKKWVTDWANQL